MIEKYSFKRIIKDINPSAVGTDGNRSLVPGTAFHAENARLTSAQGNNVESVENLKGNLLRENATLPNGTNTVIGAYEDIEGFSIIYFLHNSLNNHSIQRFYGDSNTFEEIVQWSGLNFSGKTIRGIGLAGDNLYWTDGENQVRYLDLSEDYNAPNESLTNLYLKPPTKAPTGTFTTNTSILLNKISPDSWQFAYRYVYENGGVSRLSPYSKLLPAKNFPLPTDSADNSIVVTTRLDDDLDLVERIEFFYRKNNSDTVYFFDEAIDPTPGFTYQRTFTNELTGFALPTEDFSRSDEAIPVLSDTLAYFKDRLFLTDSILGRDVEEGNYTVSVNRIATAKRPGLQFKERGSYSFGLKFTDNEGRNTLVKKAGDLEFDSLLPTANSGDPTEFSVNVSARQYARIIASGTAPNWATKAQIVMTRETSMSTYMQFVGYAAFLSRYDGSDVFGEEPTSSEVEHISSGRFYQRGDEDAFGFASSITHFLTPPGLPFEPEEGMFIRLIDEVNGEIATLKIAKFFGDAIEVYGTLPEIQDGTYANWAVSPYSTRLLCEVFKPAETQEDLFYEIGHEYDIPSDGTLSIDEIIEGDTHILDDPAVRGGSVSSLYNGLYSLYNTRFVDFSQGAQEDGWDSFRSLAYAVVESPSPTTKSVRYDLTGENNITNSEMETIVADYTKISWNQGRSFVLQERNGQDEQPSRVVYSDTFIQDSFTNGLHNFDASNKKSIPRELGPIVKLLPMEGNIMLAIHERETSSLTIGDGFIKVGDDDFILQKTESVVGDERNLRGGFGTIYPESADEYDGQGFFFDIFKGAIVRYTLNGVFPVSNFGMRNYFQQLSQKYFPYRKQIKVVGGIDLYHNEYVITFPSIPGVTDGETWAFNYVENEWNSKYLYESEMFSRLGNRFISFKNGALYEHNANEIHNNFYGVQYNRKITFYANPEVTKTKRALNIHILMDGDLSIDPELKVVVIRTPQGQESFIKAKHFVKSEGTWYAPFFKDINTVVPDGRVPLVDGRDIRDKLFTIDIETDRTDVALLHEVSIKFVESEYSR